MVRRELQDHTADECPETLIPCPNQCTKQRQVQIQQIKRLILPFMVSTPHLSYRCYVQKAQQISLNISEFKTLIREN